MNNHPSVSLVLCLLAALLCYLGVSNCRATAATAEVLDSDAIQVVVTRHDGTPVEGVGVLVLGQDVIESPFSVEYHELPRAVMDSRGIASFDGIEHDGTIHVQLADGFAFLKESPERVRELNARFWQLAREAPIKSTYPIDVPTDRVVNLRLDAPAFVKIATEEVAPNRYPMIATWEGASPRVYAFPLEPDSDGFVVYPVPADEHILVIASFPSRWLIDAVKVPAGETHDVQSLAPRLERATDTLTVTIEASPDLDHESSMGYSNFVTIWSRESGIALMGRFIPTHNGFVFMQPDGTMSPKAELPRGTLVAARGGPLFLGLALPGFGAQASTTLSQLTFEGRSPNCVVFEPDDSQRSVQIRIDDEGIMMQYPKSEKR